MTTITITSTHKMSQTDKMALEDELQDIFGDYEIEYLD